MTWHKIADKPEDIFKPGQTVGEMDVQGKKICVARRENGVFACAATCPHAGGRLAEGHVDALGNIVCPVHKYRFSLKNGYNSSGEGYHLRVYPVEQREDGIYVGLPVG